MNVIRGLWCCLFFFLLLTTPQLHAEKKTWLSVSLEESGCTSLSIGFSVSSDHTEKGDRGGQLNQRNYGKVGECFLDRNRRFYMLTGALTNSNWGATGVHGYGVRFRSPQIWRLSVEGGYEATLAYYEHGCPTSGPYAQLGCSHNRRAIIAPLPMLYIGMSFELPSVRQLLAPFLSQVEAVNLPRFMQLPMGEITIGRRWLGGGIVRTNEDIYLNTITWTSRF